MTYDSQDHWVWHAYLNMSLHYLQNRSREIDLFSLKSIQNSPPNPAILWLHMGIQMTIPLVAILHQLVKSLALIYGKKK